MGSSATGILAYGYDLGDGSDLNWGLGEYETPEWWDDDDGDVEFATAVMRRLLAVLVGFTETDEDGQDGYHERESAAEKALGLELVSHGCDESFDGWILAAVSHDASWGETVVVDGLDVPAGTDARLAEAIAALRLTPERDRPHWLLAASYG